MQRGQQLDGLIQEVGVLQEGDEAPVYVGAATEDDLGSMPLNHLLVVARIPERLPANAQGERLLGFSSIEARRHHPEWHGIEGGEVAEVSAARRIEAVILLRAWV